MILFFNINHKLGWWFIFYSFVLFTGCQASSDRSTPIADEGDIKLGELVDFHNVERDIKSSSDFYINLAFRMVAIDRSDSEYILLLRNDTWGHKDFYIRLADPASKKRFALWLLSLKGQSKPIDMAADLEVIGHLHGLGDGTTRLYYRHTGDAAFLLLNSGLYQIDGSGLDFYTDLIHLAINIGSETEMRVAVPFNPPNMYLEYKNGYLIGVMNDMIGTKVWVAP